MTSRGAIASIAGLTAVLALATACSSGSDTAGGATSDGETIELATELIDRYAVAVFDRDQEALAALLSDAYLLRRTDGSGYDKQGYVDAIGDDTDYELVSYEVRDITARRSGPVLVAEFTLEGEIQEGGQLVTAEPSPSLVTFVEVEGKWQLASDAFFSQ